MTAQDGPSRNPDEAAVLGTTLAAAITISVAEGPWEPIESVIGLVLILVILAYMQPHRARQQVWSRARRWAVAGVLGLCVSLALAWPLEWGFGNTDPTAPPEEALGMWALPIAWAVTTGVALLLLNRRGVDPARRRRGRRRPGRRRGASPGGFGGDSPG